MKPTDFLEAAGQIKITRIPAGEAPLEVRQAWVGLILPFKFLTQPDARGYSGVISHQPQRWPRRAFIVPQDRAIEILTKSNPTAAQWWGDNGYPKTPGDFAFQESEVEILSQIL